MSDVKKETIPEIKHCESLPDDFKIVLDRYNHTDRLLPSFDGYTRPVKYSEFNKLLEGCHCRSFYVAEETSTPVGTAITKGIKKEPIGLFGVWTISKRSHIGEIFICSSGQKVEHFSVALNMFIDWIFNELGLYKINARVFKDSKEYEELKIDQGFEHECILKNEVRSKGKYKDVVILSKINSNW